MFTFCICKTYASNCKLVINFYVIFSTAQVAYRYHLAVGPVDGRLYISDPEKHQILRVKQSEDSFDVKDNLEVVVGSGEKCLPGDKFSCGDGRLAKLARLAYPKGNQKEKKCCFLSLILNLT